LTALAAAAAATIIKAMATDAWSAVSSGFARLFGDDQDDKVGEISAAMEQSKDRVAAGSDSKSTPVNSIEEARWSGRIEAMLERDPGLQARLTELVPLMESRINNARSSAGETSMIISSGRDTYAAGRDQHFVRRNNDDG